MERTGVIDAVARRPETEVGSTIERMGVGKRDDLGWATFGR